MAIRARAKLEQRSPETRWTGTPIPEQSEKCEAGTKPSRSAAELLRDATLAVIKFYQRAISPLTPPTCRFYPTCSHYTYAAISRFGLARGGWLGLVRLAKCHPFHRGGFDPVPEAENKLTGSGPAPEPLNTECSPETKN